MPFRERILLIILSRHNQKFGIITPITLQPTKTMYRRTSGSSTKMQNPPQLFLIKFIHNLPKPFYHLMFPIIRFLILRILMPIMYINKRYPIHQHLQLVRLKYLQQLTIKNLSNTLNNLLNRFKYMYLSMYLNTMDNDRQCTIMRYKVICFNY